MKLYQRLDCRKNRNLFIFLCEHLTLAFVVGFVQLLALNLECEFSCAGGFTESVFTLFEI